MLTVTSRFRTAVRESHRVSVAATIYPADGSAPVDAQVISGSLRLDRDAPVRRTGSIVCAFDLEADVDFIRTLPFGGYVKLERGMLFADGSLERPTVGYLRVNTVSWSELEGQASIELADRFAQIQDEPLRSPYDASGKKATNAILELVQAVFPSVPTHVSTFPSGEPVLADSIFESDRAKAISDLATSISASAYFDAAGDFVLEPDPPDPATVTTPDWTFDVGAEGNLEQVAENLDRSAVRNGIALKGQSKASNPPYYTLVTDDDPSSPTRWGGPFGKVALLVELSTLMSKAQAKDVGASLLNLRLGLARTITLRGVPMPALEPDDVLTVRYLDGRQEQLRVNAVTLPLDVASTMELVATGHYRPDVLTPARRRRRVGAVTGPAVWRELEGAEVMSS